MKIFTSIFWILLLTPISSFANIVIKPVAIVNDELISNLDIEREENILKHFSRENMKNEDIYNFSLDNLIRNSLLRREAKILNIDFSNEELNEYIKNFMENTGNREVLLENYVKVYGLDYVSVLNTIQSKLIFDKIVAKKILSTVRVTEDEIKSFQEEEKFGINSDYIIDFIKVSYPISSDHEVDNLTFNLLDGKSSNIKLLETNHKDISIDKLVMNSAHMLNEVKKEVDDKKINDIVGPIIVNNKKSFLKIVDKVFLTEIKNSDTVHFKKVNIPANYKKINILKNKDITCDEITKLSNEDLSLKTSELKVNAAELTTDIHLILQKIKQDGKSSKIIEKDNSSATLIVLCKNIEDIELIHRKIYSNKVSLKVNSMLENIYRKSFIKK